MDLNLTASEACNRSKNAQKNNGTADEINYSLTLRRVLDLIRIESEQGRQKMVFVAPCYVIDGCLANPIVLAKQIKARLTELGYNVDRKEELLIISWAANDIKKVIISKKR